MPYDTENVLDSERAYQVLRLIILESETRWEVIEGDNDNGPEGLYGTQVSKKLGIRQQLASEIINHLERVSLLEKGERTQAQYYRWDMDGTLDLFQELWLEEAEDKEFMEEIGQKLEVDKEERTKFYKFVLLYVLNYVQALEESSIRKMLVEDLYEGINSYKAVFSSPDSPKEPPEWLDIHFFLLKQAYPGITPQGIVYSAIDVLEEDMPDWVEEESKETDLN
ncbi:MAG: hypothetical protein ABEJ72_02925 [Candidatus Aenigmatarchaeota archaeon]